MTANHDGSPHDDLVSVRGRVTAFVYDDKDVDDDQNDTDDIDDENETDDDMDYDHNETDDMDDENETDDADDVEENETDDARITSVQDKEKILSEMKVSAFIVDNNTIVELGPWWYWVSQGVNITDFVHIGDWVNVTGALEEDEEDGMDVLSAWHIENITTGDELTIKEEGRPPWAGGPKALGIDPWPMSE